MMHAARSTSPRLSRLVRLLKDGRPHSTRDIARRAHVLAISASVSELRFRGAEIHCERQKVGDRWVFFYTMTKEPDDV